MAGLLGDVLPFIYSRSNALKRNVNSLLDSPIDYLKQGVGQGNDDARVQNGLLADAVKEGESGPLNNALQNQTGNFLLHSFFPMAIDPMAKPLWVNQLATGETNGQLRLGDMTSGQGKRARGLLGNGPETNDITATEFRSDKVKGKRIDEEGFSAPFIGDVTEQGMRKSSDLELDPASRNTAVSMVQRGMRDPETGKPYDARIPLKVSADGKTWELVSVVPDGLPPRKTKPPSR